MSSSDTTITFVGTVDRVSQLVDGGLRVSFDMPESAIAQAALLMECKRLGLVLQVNCFTVDNNAIQTRGKRKSKRTPKEE